jgi:indole-3-glycerol phosphate synthase
VQAFPAWLPPGGTLGQILAETEQRVGELKRRRRSLEASAAEHPSSPSFAAALRHGDVAIVAEVKRRSPSRGHINSSLSPRHQATSYVVGGAAAISVLTEERHFGGSPDDLVAVRSAVSIPVLKKDFHVDPIQLLEARVLGASAALLIARALTPASLRTMALEAESLGIEAFVEVRTEAELESALATNAPVLGVNCRDLESLAVDFEVTERILPLIPRTRVAIAESGVTGRADVERAAACGADAVLVGSVLSAAADAAAAVRVLTGVTRRVRRA